MKSFEQQTVDAIRNLTAVCVILAVGLVLGIGVAAWGLIEAGHASNAAKAGLVKQTRNRTLNVALWCTHLNALDDSLEGYVALFPRAPQLHLKRLDCAALESKTLASTKPH